MGVGNVEDQDEAHGVSVEGRRQRAEPLLTGSVPQLQKDFAGLLHHDRVVVVVVAVVVVVVAIFITVGSTLGGKNHASISPVSLCFSSRPS